MSDVNTSNEDADDFLIFNGDDIDDFFKDYNPENEESGASTEKSQKEKMALYGGDLTDIEAFLKHEETRLKFLEFKLKKKTQLKESHSKFKDNKNERRLRKENAKKAFIFSSTWAIFIACFVLLHGFKGIRIPFFRFGIRIDFKITETEFIFVCGTLTASVLIFYLMVIKNLFPNKHEPEKNKESSE